MKKYILVVLLAMVGTTAFAQKGMQEFGVNFEYTESSTETFGAGIKYQYHIANRDRLEATISVRSGGEWELAISNNWFFNGIKRFRPYFISGITMGNVLYEDSYYGYYNSYTEKYTVFDAGFRLGLGLNCRLSHNWSCQLELGGNAYLLGEIEGGSGFFRLGTTYNF